MLKKLHTAILASFFSLLLLAAPLYAQEGDIPGDLKEIRPGVYCSTGQVNTALGCISTTPEDFVNVILGFAVGISGAIALLLLLYGFFTISTSQGNPDQVRQGKEIITSAIAGLIFVAMSVVLMGFIGINILGIPGLS